MKVSADWYTAAFMPEIMTVFVLLSVKLKLPVSSEFSNPLSRGAAAVAAAKPVQTNMLPGRNVIPATKSANSAGDSRLLLMLSRTFHFERHEMLFLILLPDPSLTWLQSHGSSCQSPLTHLWSLAA